MKAKDMVAICENRSFGSLVLEKMAISFSSVLRAVPIVLMFFFNWSSDTEEMKQIFMKSWSLFGQTHVHHKYCLD